MRGFRCFGDDLKSAGEERARAVGGGDGRGEEVVGVGRPEGGRGGAMFFEGRGVESVGFLWRG